MKPFRELTLLLALFTISLAAISPQGFVRAEETQLEDKIRETNAKIAELEKEIAKYESDLSVIGTAKKTLENEIQRLDVSRKKINTDISLTERRINGTNLELEELGSSIEDKSRRIEIGKNAIQESLRALDHIGDATFGEYLFTSLSLRDAWEASDGLRHLQTTIRDEIAELSVVKSELTEDFEIEEAKKAKLLSLKKELAGQRAVLDQNKKTQSTVLSETKSKESEYQKILEAKRAAKLEFEKELNEYEGKLEYSADPNAIPSPGSGVLGFPLDPEYMSRCKDKEKTYKNIYCVSQYFGNTSFAASGAYNGKGHNGIDFGAPEGTKVVAALDGVVLATGNTDIYKGCYSYGKWALIQHDNGLSTLYAHLSHIAQAKGDQVSTGDLIGYTGNTGYSTGPHLHFSVYASSGVRLVRLGDIKAKTNCANATVPVAPTAAYLNPLSYF